MAYTLQSFEHDDGVTMETYHTRSLSIIIDSTTPLKFGLLALSVAVVILPASISWSRDTGKPVRSLSFREKAPTARPTLRAPQRTTAKNRATPTRQQPLPGRETRPTQPTSPFSHAVAHLQSPTGVALRKIATESRVHWQHTGQALPRNYVSNQIDNARQSMEAVRRPQHLPVTRLRQIASAL